MALMWLGTAGARATAWGLVASLGRAPQSEVSCLGPILTTARVIPSPVACPQCHSPSFPKKSPWTSTCWQWWPGHGSPLGAMSPFPKAEHHASSAQKTVPRAGRAPGRSVLPGDRPHDSRCTEGPVLAWKVAHPSYLGPTCSPPPPGGCAEWPWPWGHDLGGGPYLRSARG